MFSIINSAIYLKSTGVFKVWELSRDPCNSLSGISIEVSSEITSPFVSEILSGVFKGIPPKRFPGINSGKIHSNLLWNIYPEINAIISEGLEKSRTTTMWEI